MDLDKKMLCNLFFLWNLLPEVPVLWMYALFHLANVLRDLCFLHERLLIYHDKKAVISMLWYLFSHDSSAGDLVSPAVFQGPNRFGKPFVYALRWWWEEKSWTEFVFQRDTQHSLKIRFNSCFFKLIKFSISFEILSLAFLKCLTMYIIWSIIFVLVSGAVKCNV